MRLASLPTPPMLALAVALSVAACAGERFSTTTPQSGAPPAATARPMAPPVNMAGRWVLASPSSGQCFATFGAASATAVDGTIAPEGGCPGDFFTSRRWAYDSSGLSIRDHNNNPLAQLSSVAGGRFEGRSTDGMTITLSR